MKRPQQPAAAVWNNGSPGETGSEALPYTTTPNGCAPLAPSRITYFPSTMAPTKVGCSGWRMRSAQNDGSAPPGLLGKPGSPMLAEDAPWASELSVWVLRDTTHSSSPDDCSSTGSSS